MTNSSNIENPQDAIWHYTKYFKDPFEVIDSNLSKNDKIELLKQWKQDTQLQDIAEEENMPNSKRVPLERILEALQALGIDSVDAQHSPPTKLGGI